MRFSRFEYKTEQELRIVELNDIGYTYLANKIESCKRGWTCNQRLCPVCGPRYAAKNAFKIELAARKMFMPYIYIVSQRSRNIWDLDATIRQFKHSLSKLRNRKYWKEHVKAGAGALEVQVTTDGKAWNVHIHLILDVNDNIFDTELINQYWHLYTDGLGTFLPQREHRVISYNLPALARYNGKSDTWCPPPGTLYPDQLKVLIGAIKRKQIPIIFPSRRKQKKL